MDTKGLRLLQSSLIELQTYVEGIGGCDHSVNIYCCKLNDLIEDIKKYTINWATQKCPICDNVILRDESYIQNCDGIQHLNCYNNMTGAVSEMLAGID